MNKRFPLLAATTLLIGMTAAQAQVAPVDFETGGHGANWTWTVFENDTNPAVQIVSNPAPGGVNTSSTVALFTALQSGNPWAGCETQHGSDIGTFSLDETNCTVRVMVYKTEISNVGVKFAKADGSAANELLVANTLVNQWEELVFDFSGRIGDPLSTNIDQFILFPRLQHGWPRPGQPDLLRQYQLRRDARERCARNRCADTVLCGCKCDFAVQRRLHERHCRHLVGGLGPGRCGRGAD